MGVPQRRRPAIQSRKRVDEEGEEEGGVIPDLEDDSASEVSAGSDADDDADGEASDDSGNEATALNTTASVAAQHRKPAKGDKPTVDPLSAPESTLTAFNADTEAMINGMKISDEPHAEEIDFDQAVKTNGDAQVPVGPSGFATGNTTDVRRREHEEYKKRRDADPAFVPNRGGFFMHDQRSGAMQNQNGLRPFGRGAARGRAMPRGSFHGISYSQPSGPADRAWSHDLHETIAGPNERAHQRHGIGRDFHQRHPNHAPSQPRGPNRDFSSTLHLGDMQVRLFINGMAVPKDFVGVKRNIYTKLPFHRPPLRRDKPVRVSIPSLDVKYIFPSPDRSFIFIPRALRPNQQGFGKVKGRGSFGANYIGYGPMSSRRTSVYGGSNYSPNTMLSRRSSIAARDIAPGSMAPQAQAGMQQHVGSTIDLSKPVVRLPPAAELLSHHIPSGAASVVSMTSGPNDQQRGAEDLPMHHPKPERSLQVSEIVSPAVADFSHPAPLQQPFHQQVPVQMPPQGYANNQARYPHSRQPSHPSQASASTPLPQIPEAAIHAQTFQPYGYQPPQNFYQAQYPMYFYPPTDPTAGSPAAPPTFVPGQPYYYPMPVTQPPPLPTGEPNTPGGTVAQEAGGMVFYSYPENNAGPETGPAYQPTYPAESMVPSPFYPQNTPFYPPPPPPPMQ